MDGDVRFPADDLERSLRYFDLLSEGANLGVGTCGLCRDGDFHAVMCGRDSFRVRASRFHGSSNATEVVELIAQAEDSLMNPDGLGSPTGQLEDLICPGIAAPG